VAQERPVGPGDVDFAELDRHQENFLLIDTRLRENLSARARDKTLSPELQAVPTDGTLESHPIDRRDIAAVRDRVTALDRFPRAVLILSVFFFLFGMPADRGRVE